MSSQVPKASHSTRLSQLQKQTRIPRITKKAGNSNAGSTGASLVVQNKGTSNWEQSLQTLLQQFDRTSAEAIQATQVLRRHAALSQIIQLRQSSLQPDVEIHDTQVVERVEKTLEQEEREWEQQMQKRQNRLERLEKVLMDMRRGTSADPNQQAQENTQEVEEVDGLSQLQRDNASLREVLALRMEEKTDLQAAISSFAPPNLAKKRKSSTDSQSQKKSKRLVAQIKRLENQKQRLQQEIIDCDAQQVSEALQTDDSLQQLCASVKTTQQHQQIANSSLDKHKKLSESIKNKMKRMVRAHVLQRKASQALSNSAFRLHEEAVILHLLYEHQGEMNATELKSSVVEQGSSSAATTRALYALVVNGLVHIDRSQGSGVVTSLII